MNYAVDHVYVRQCSKALSYPDGRRVIQRGDSVCYQYGKTTFAAKVIQPGKCRVLIEYQDAIGGKQASRVRWCVPDCLVFVP